MRWDILYLIRWFTFSLASVTFMNKPQSAAILRFPRHASRAVLATMTRAQIIPLPSPRTPNKDRLFSAVMALSFYDQPLDVA
jgi:hypothetical protein